MATFPLDRPKQTLVVALVLAVAAIVYGGNVGSSLKAGVSGFQDPSSESAAARDAFFRSQGFDPANVLIVLVKAPAGVADPDSAVRLRAVEARVHDDPLVSRTYSYASTRNPALVSRDGRETYVVVGMSSTSPTAVDQAAKRLRSEFAERPDVTVGGIPVADIEVAESATRDLQRAELFAFPILFLLLLRVFRGAVAAALPTLVGGLAIILSMAGLRFASESTTVSIYALNLATGLGLGLGIDYSLLVVSRFREELARRNADVRIALERTLATAGKTVLFSSATVALALGALLIFPEPFLYSMGIAGVLVATGAGFTALVVLPAVLMLLGDRVNALSPKRRKVSSATPESMRSPRWRSFAAWVMRRPAPLAVAAALILLSLGAVFTKAEFTFGDPSVLEKEAEARQVYDALEQRFPVDQTFPVLVAVRSETPEATARALDRRLSGVEGVAHVIPSDGRPVDGDYVLASAITQSPPISKTSEEVVRDVRSLDGLGAVLVGGYTAEFIDLKRSLVDLLPVALALIVLTTFMLILALTKSVVLAAKVLVMNALTVFATLGMLVLIFQDGFLQGPLGFETVGAIGTTEPIVVMALAFALSTDYTVFLLARIKEEHDKGYDDREAVAAGLERVGRIVTAAAVLFAVALGALVISHNVYVKQLGLGAAIAVLIDATLVRAVLVPSLMALLGRWNWWAPGHGALRSKRL